MTTHTSSQPKGFIALLSVMIIAVTLLAVSVSTAGNTFFARFNGLNREYKRISKELASSCANIALARIGGDYTYNITKDSLYSSSRGAVVIPIGEIYDRSAECLITSPTVTPSEVGGKRTFPIIAKANFSGAFSTIEVQAKAQDPGETPLVPPPTCALSVSPSSIPLGQSVSLLWSVSGVAASMSINQGIGGVNPAQTSAPWPTDVPTGTGAKTYTATVTNGSGSRTCEATLTVTAPPPSPACADTAIILDRSGSMSSTDLANERSASHALIDLYAGAGVGAKVAAGSFGPLGGGSGASIPTSPNGQLTTLYNTLKSTVTTITGSNSSVGSNLGEAIRVGAEELASIRHTAGKDKVLIFVSDGLPNQPSSGVSTDSGWKLPTAESANVPLTDFWNTPRGAFESGEATTSLARSHHYRDFDFSIPTGSTIRGIETEVTGRSSGGSISTLLTESFGTGATSTNIANWDEEGDDNDSTTQAIPGTLSGFNSTSPNGGRFALIGTDEWICREVSATGLSSLSLMYYYRGDFDAENSDSLIVEYSNGSDCGNSGGWTTLSTHALNSPTSSWSSEQTIALPSLLNNDPSFRIRYRADSNASGEDARVDGIRITGSSNQCSLAFDISGSAGISWSNTKNLSLTSTNATSILGSPTDTWGSSSWNSGSFTNGNFRMRVRSLAAGPTCSLDTLRGRVYYTQNINPSDYARAQAADAESDGVTIFSIHYGDSSGLPFMQELSSDSTLPSVPITQMTRSSNVVSATPSAPHKLLVNQYVTISGATPTTFNGSYRVTSVPTANTFRFSQSGATQSATGGTARPTNLFASPPSSAMSSIFQSIGYQVCPAAAPECSNGIDDDGDGYLDEEDSACHTDGSAANAGSYDAGDEDEWSDPVVPTPPPPPPPPPTIDIESWVETP